MKPLTIVLIALSWILVAACARSEESASNARVTASERTLTGQLLLPSGFGSRGVEILVTLADGDTEPGVVWVLFDERGHFDHRFRGRLTAFEVRAGHGRVLYRLDEGALLGPGGTNPIELGAIDLRQEVVARHVTVRAAQDESPSVVRVGMWSGPPPVGPFGESVSLGSRQFPEIALGSEQEWLLPHEVESVYLLVERPAGTGRGIEWRSGRQQLFGPFSTPDFPLTLLLD